MTDKIESLADLRPGDLLFGPIGGAVGIGVGLGQLALGEAFRVGRLSIRHVGVVVESMDYVGPELAGPFLVQAMPHGAEEIEMTKAGHWTPRHAYVRLPEDYPGQALDAAAIARLMVSEGVAYSPASYLALAFWRWGLKTPRLEEWIGRRRQPVMVSNTWGRAGWDRSAGADPVRLPCEAICSVLADQSWSLTGKRIMVGVPHQVVTPGALAARLLSMPGVVWGWPRLL